MYRPGNRRPRVGEKRKAAMPLKVERLSAAVREFIERARAGTCECGATRTSPGRPRHFHTWPEIETLASGIAGEKISKNACWTWYDIRVRQVEKEALAEREADREWARAIAGTPFEKLPETIREEFSREVFRLRRAKPGGAEYRKGLEALGWLVSDLRKSEVAAAKVDLEKKKQKLAELKFEELKSKADKATNEAAAKLEKGRALTKDDINRIRERALGLPAL